MRAIEGLYGEGLRYNEDWYLLRQDFWSNDLARSPPWSVSLGFSWLPVKNEGQRSRSKWADPEMDKWSIVPVVVTLGGSRSEGWRLKMLENASRSMEQTTKQVMNVLVDFILVKRWCFLCFFLFVCMHVYIYYVFSLKAKDMDSRSDLKLVFFPLYFKVDNKISYGFTIKFCLCSEEFGEKGPSKGEVKTSWKSIVLVLSSFHV